MRIIRELVDLLGERYLPLPDNALGQRARKLYERLRKGEDLDDHAAAERLSLTPGSPAFRKVKQHLKIALLNGVTALAPPEKLPEPRSRGEAAEGVLNMVALTQEQAPGARAAITPDYLNGMLDVAREREFVELEAILDQYLLDTTNPAHVDFPGLLEQSAFSIEKDHANLMAFRHTTHVALLSRQYADRETVRSYLEYAIDEIDLFLPLLPELSDAIFYRSSNLQHRKWISAGNYEEAIRVAQSVVERFSREGKSKYRAVLRMFQNMLVEGQLLAGRPERAFTIARRVLTLPYQGEMNKYATYELAMVAGLRAERFQEVYEIFLSLDHERFFAVENKFAHDTMRIIQAYLHLLLKMKVIRKQAGDGKFTRFRIHKFLNDLGFSLKEKSRRNVHVIIIRIIDLALREKEPDVQLNDTIKKYVQRHLQEQRSVRARAILLALMQIPENGFDKHFFLPKAKRYLDLLGEHPLPTHEQYLYLELIPFERLFQLLLERLE